MSEKVMAGNLDLTPFIVKAQFVEKELGIPASVTLAQIIQESRGSYEGGLSGLAYMGKNPFGMKGTGTAGQYISDSPEWNGTSYVSKKSGFMKFNSYEEAFQRRNMVLQLPRYQQLFKDADSVEDFAVAIQQGGWATSPTYATNMINNIKTYDLTRFDSGKYKFTGKTVTTEDMKKELGKNTYPSNTKTETDDKRGFFNGIAYSIFHAVVIILVIGVGILFFMKSFNLSTSFKGGKESE